ncbi:MAG: hypothetical protein GXO88_13230, partial [Chlorobi bacterium]|nr:hypothetical protein [Chlorobiota bacterium]
AIKHHFVFANTGKAALHLFPFGSRMPYKDGGALHLVLCGTFFITGINILAAQNNKSRKYNKTYHPKNNNAKQRGAEHRNNCSTFESRRLRCSAPPYQMASTNFIKQTE